MASPKRIVLFVEGEGDETAAPLLVRRLLTNSGAWGNFILDGDPFRVGGIGDLVRKDAHDWIRLLKAAAKTRRPLGGVLLLLDGDADRALGKPFCSRDVAFHLSERARDAGAGAVFSVASVFACCEYESWLLAGLESLVGKQLPDGRAGVEPTATAPTGNLEQAPRDAKGWLRKHMAGGYKPTVDQTPLTELVNLEMIRQRQLRSFQRFEKAVQELVLAVMTGQHFVSPTKKEP